MFFMDWSLAMQFLEPIYTYLKDKHPDWEYYFVANDELSIKEVLDKGYPHKMFPEGYDWAICCDGWSACPRKNRINTFHGMASKGHELSSNRAGHYPGVHVAMSPYIRDILINRMGVLEDDIIDGGMTKLDTIKRIPPLRSKPKILYAPTFNPELSSLPILEDSILELNPTVKLHSYTENAGNIYHEKLRSHVKENKDPNYKEDITQMYLDHDIIIADSGSTVVEPLALARMVIRVQNPLWLQFYKDRGVEEEEIKSYPEIYYPDKYAFDAQSVEEITEIIQRYYPTYEPPKEEIISNVGNFKVSKKICEYIEQS